LAILDAISLARFDYLFSFGAEKSRLLLHI